MPVHSPIAALVATAVAVAGTVSASSADQGHPATREAMQRVVRTEDVPGVLGGAADGGSLWQDGYGVADLGTGRPRLPGDRFRIGSLTKPFVATVLLQLEAEGRVGLDDTVEHWLPGTVQAHGNDGSRITLRHLLRHTSGIPDFASDPRVLRAFFSREFLDNRWASHRPADLVHTATERPPEFAPGTGWRYSNTNYVLAGMVIRKVTGHSYAHEIEHRIVRPLRLRDTSLPGTSTVIPGPSGRAYSALLSSGSSSGAHDVTSLNPSLAGASGEMISSVRDLMRFLRALLSGELLPAAQQREMRRTVSVSAGRPADRYGLGLAELTLSCGVRVWGHDGTIHGSRSLTVGTDGGEHVAAFNINADWSGDPLELVEAEYCG